MKKLLLIAPIALLALATACGGGGGGEETSSAPAKSAAPPAAPLDAGTAGTITGTVTLEGDAPEMKTIQMAADPSCARMHTEPVKTEFVVVGDGGTLANVFVYVKSGVHGDFPPPTEPVLLDQKGCLYSPHVIGIQVGQPLKIRNDDETLHNIHAMPKNNKEFNIGQPVKGLETEKTFDNPEVMVPFKCDVHKWMNSYAGVLDHPYFAVTKTDGSFSIPNLAPGDYVLEAWHERLGTKEMNVTIEPSGTAEANITFTAE